MIQSIGLSTQRKVRTFDVDLQLPRLQKRRQRLWHFTSPNHIINLSAAAVIGHTSQQQYKNRI